MGDMIDDQHDLHIDAREEDLQLDDLYDTRSEAGSSDGGSRGTSPDSSKSDPKPVITKKDPRPTVTLSKHYDYVTKLNYLFRDTRFFVIKSNNEENVLLSKKLGRWSTLPQNELKLNEAFDESRNVLLIFSVKESGKFHGFARLGSRSTRDVSPVRWVLPPGMNPGLLSSVFQVDWICRNQLSFTDTSHLFNPWNDMKPVKIGRDGQEIEPKVAEGLLRLFSEDTGIDMTPILRKSKEASQKFKSRSGRKTRPVSRTSPVIPRSRFRHEHSMTKLRRTEEIALMHGLPPLPYGPPGMFPPAEFDIPPPHARYYDVPIPPLMPAHFMEKHNYNRSVDEFLFRNREKRVRSRSRERIRQRRSRSRSRDRGARPRERNDRIMKRPVRGPTRRRSHERRSRSRSRDRRRYRR